MTNEKPATHGHRDNGKGLEWLLREHGPHFLNEDPPDQIIFERLDAFGEAVWCIEGNSGRQYVRDLWISQLKACTLIEHPWRTVEAAIRAGEKTVSITTLGLEADRKPFAPRSVADLLADPALEQTANWLIQRYVARGNLTIIAGHGKIGKSTFGTELATGCAGGQDFLGAATTQAAVLWINLEQTEALTAAKFRELDPPDNLPLMVWTGTRDAFTVEELVGYIQEHEIGLVVIDSLHRFWKLDDSKDDVQVSREMGVLLHIARETKAAVLVIAHVRKSGGGGDDLLDIAGSYAIIAAADIAITFHRHKASGDTARLLQTISRYGGHKLVVNMENGRYRAVGEPDHVKAQQTENAVLSAVEEEPMEVKDIAEGAGCSRASAVPVLNAAYERGEIQRQGRGVKGDPYTYNRRKSFLSAPNSGAVTETVNRDTQLEAVSS